MKREKDDDEKDSKDVLESDEDLSPEEVNNLIKEAQGKQEAKVKVEEEPSGGRRGKKSRGGGGGGGAKGKKEVETKDEKKPTFEQGELPTSAISRPRPPPFPVSHEHACMFIVLLLPLHKSLFLTFPFLLFTDSLFLAVHLEAVFTP